METSYLTHHGIKGQKWGVQNGPPYPLEYGSLSVAERRADTGEIKVDRTDKGKVALADYKNMSNKDLRELTERIELENRYLRAYDTSKGKSGIEKAVDVTTKVSSFLNNANSISQALTGKSIIQNLSKIKLGSKEGSDEKTTEAKTSENKDNSPFNSNKWLNKNINKKSGSYFEELGKTFNKSGGSLSESSAGAVSPGKTPWASTAGARTSSESNKKPSGSFNANKWLNKNINRSSSSALGDLGKAFSDVVSNVTTSSVSSSSTFNAEDWLDKNIDTSRSITSWTHDW